MSHVARFVALYQHLRYEASHLGPMQLVSAGQAATLVLAERDELVRALPGAMEQMSEATALLSGLQGGLGQTLVALALVRGVEPATLPSRTDFIRGRFTEHGIPRKGLWPELAAGWLALEPDAVVDQVLPRIAAIMAAWKQDHPWITGHDDLHAAVLHALGTAPVRDVRRLTEDRYIALKAAGFTWAPDTLQRAAQLAALYPQVSAGDVGRRFKTLREDLRFAGKPASGAEREAVVLLACTNASESQLAADYTAALSQLYDGGLGRFWDARNRAVLAAGLVAADHFADQRAAVQGMTLAAIVAAIHAAIHAHVIAATASPAAG